MNYQPSTLRRYSQCNLPLAFKQQLNQQEVHTQSHPSTRSYVPENISEIPEVSTTHEITHHSQASQQSYKEEASCSLLSDLENVLQKVCYAGFHESQAQEGGERVVEQIELFCSNLNLAVQKLIQRYKHRFFREELSRSSSFAVLSPASTNLPSVSSPSCDHIKISNLNSCAQGLSTDESSNLQNAHLPVESLYYQEEEDHYHPQEEDQPIQSSRSLFHKHFLKTAHSILQQKEAKLSQEQRECITPIEVNTRRKQKQRIELRYASAGRARPVNKSIISPKWDRVLRENTSSSNRSQCLNASRSSRQVNMKSAAYLEGLDSEFKYSNGRSFPKENRAINFAIATPSPGPSTAHYQFPQTTQGAVFNRSTEKFNWTLPSRDNPAPGTYKPIKHFASRGLSRNI